MTEAELAVRTMKDPNADTSSVLSSTARVPASEPASLWSDVANDASVPPYHRGVAAWQLLKRHVPAGTSLGQAGNQLAGAAWLEVSELEKITALGGELPVVVPDAGSAFVLRFPRGAAQDAPELGAYLALDVDLSEGALRDALAARASDGKVTTARITGIAMFPETLSTASK